MHRLNGCSLTIQCMTLVLYRQIPPAEVGIAAAAQASRTLSAMLSNMPLFYYVMHLDIGLAIMITPSLHRVRSRRPTV